MKKTPPPSELIPFETLRMDMIVPTTGIPITEQSIHDYALQLSIPIYLQQIKGRGRERRHVTKDAAAELVKLFKIKHWRKFKAAEQK